MSHPLEVIWMRYKTAQIAIHKTRMLSSSQAENWPYIFLTIQETWLTCSYNSQNLKASTELFTANGSIDPTGRRIPKQKRRRRGGGGGHVSEQGLGSSTASSSWFRGDFRDEGSDLLVTCGCHLTSSGRVQGGDERRTLGLECGCVCHACGCKNNHLCSTL